MKIKTILAKNYVNFRGWNSKRKIVLIESDDWGSVRMPSREVYEKLLKAGIPVDKSYFTKYDSLESIEDLNSLFEVLKCFKDINGRHPSVTANALVTNPNFDLIKENSFTTFEFEMLENTYQRYYGDAKIFGTWDEGIQERLLYPQFHGREHLGVWEWMNALRSEERQEQLGFEYKAILGLGNRKSSTRQKDYTAAFDYVSDEEKNSLIGIIEEGLDLFENTYGFPSKSFAAQGAIRGDYLDEVLSKKGVLYHQLGQQFHPDGRGGFNVINRYWGETNKYGQIYWRRNATFEPSRNPSFDWVDSCMKEIAIAFFWGKPAVINSHRVNFVGSIDEKNRSNSLRLLKILLAAIQKKWPNVEFMTSDELGDFITQNK